MATATKTKMDRFIERAAHKLVENFSGVDGDLLQAKVEEESGDPFARPMWDRLFEVTDSCDDRAIRGLLRSGMPDDERSALGRIIDNGLGLGDDLSDYYTCDECGEGVKFEARDAFNALDDGRDLVSLCCEAGVSVAEDRLVQDTIEAWRESGDDDCSLAEAGWQNVGDTGLIAFDHDGDLYLGRNGAGYDFFEAHWVPLYKALGYSWHIAEFRAEAMHDAIKAMADAIEKNASDKRIVALAKRVAKRRAAMQHGGPLSKREQREAESER
jgi:hypothetical protein